MKIAVLLSGGVDSSVALHLLRQNPRHELTAFYLKIWLEDELSHLGDCPWEEDLRYARAVCEAADVELEVVSMQREYHAKVVSWAISELRAGRTPSPDILCNRRIKFGAFLAHLDEAFGGAFDTVASGHYARIESQDGEWRLFKGVDPVKDQTYFLYSLSQDQLRRCLFPLGLYHKHQVRALARRFALPTQGRPDSQGICFLGKIAYDDFVREYLGERRGEIREVTTQKVLGEHPGYWFYTIGQRKGLGLSGGPWYVVGKDIASDVVYVARGSNRTRDGGCQFRLGEPSWIGRPSLDGSLQVKLRHSPQLIDCRLETAENSQLDVRLAEDDSGIAPGQSAVFYRADRCLGGGTIEGAVELSS